MKTEPTIRHFNTKEEYLVAIIRDDGRMFIYCHWITYDKAEGRLTGLKYANGGMQI